MKHTLSFIACFLFSGAVFAQADSVVAPGATLQLVSDQFTFTEGPAVDREGNIFFTDQPNDKIWKYAADGTLSLYREKTGRSNGMYFDRKGNLISCADENDELWSIDKKGKVTVLLSSFEGKKFNGPNDLWIAPKGGIYFTDPFYPRDYWTRKKPDLEAERVYFLPKGAKEARIVEADIKKPNGIVGTPDGKYLYVSDIGSWKTYRYTIAPDGALTDKQLFCEQGSDGMTLDTHGNVYLSGRGVSVYNAAGKKIRQIPVPSGWVGNVCFGGKDRKTLLITASTTVYTLKMNAKGVE